MCQPSQKGVCAGDRSRNGLLDFVCQRGGKLSHHIDTVGVRKISLQLTQPFALLLGALSFGNIHGDADVLAWFSGWIAMSDRTQESDAAVGMMNPIFVKVKIRSLADRSFKNCIHPRCVFRVLSGEKAFGRYWPFAGIKAIQASVFVR